MTEMSVPLAGVLGWPITHSLSPLLHGHWLQHLGLKAHYVPLGCAPDDFAAAVPMLLKTGFRGFNVTVPHKEAAFSLADVRTPRAEQMGAVNTLWVDGGLLHGDSTDGDGFLSALPPLKAGAQALVIGAGGAAKAVVYALAGLDSVSHILIANRTLARADALCAQMQKCFPQTTFHAHALDESEHALGATDLIVNTTSLGMAGQPPLALDFSLCTAAPICYDIVYTPALTPFLSAAKQAGLETINGLPMLIGQARPGFEKWFGQPAPHTGDELRLLKEALGQT
ncbi:MAG: shikimate dehydrogenase [Pseudomonadota bacterium]